MPRESAVSILSECIVIMRLLGNDNATTASTDWGNASLWGSTGIVTLSVDRVRVTQSNQLIDTSTAQQFTEKMRAVKGGFTIQLETKLLRDGLDLGVLVSASRPVVGIQVTSQKASFWVAAVLESFEPAYEAASSLNITLRAYGYPIVWDATTAY